MRIIAVDLKKLFNGDEQSAIEVLNSPADLEAALKAEAEEKEPEPTPEEQKRAGAQMDLIREELILKCTRVDRLYLENVITLAMLMMMCESPIQYRAATAVGHNLAAALNRNEGDFIKDIMTCIKAMRDVSTREAAQR